MENGAVRQRSSKVLVGGDDRGRREGEKREGTGRRDNCVWEREPESDDGDGENEIFGLHLQLAAKVRMRKGCSPFYLPEAGAEYNRLSTGCIIRYHRSSHPLYPAPAHS